MATVMYIPEHTQSQTAMRRVMDYVVQDKKTLYERDERQFKLISGKDCYADIAFQEFMATKKQYDKAVGMFFYQYVQSFSPDEKIAPEKANTVGLELAEYFKGYEVLVATHVDTENIHNHLIINSVSFETGMKLQEGPNSLFKLRKLSDEICLSHNLTVLPPYDPNHSAAKGLNSREYRAAVKGESWKFQLMSVVDKCMATSRRKTEFIDHMAALGYQVNWAANRKHITYTTPDGRKCRDNKLHEDKYLKERMEVAFGLREAETDEQAGTVVRRIPLQAEHVRHTTGDSGTLDDSDLGNSRGTSPDKTADRGASGLGTHQGARESGLSGHEGSTDERYNDNIGNNRGLRGETADGDGGDQKACKQGNISISEAAGKTPVRGIEPEPQFDSARFRGKPRPADPEAEMDGRGDCSVSDILSAAHALENLLKINPQEKKKEKTDDSQEKEKDAEKKDSEKKQIKEQGQQKIIKRRKRNREMEWER